MRSPGFASPGTFPSQRFSRSQGFAPPHTVAALFHAAATHRVSGTETERYVQNTFCFPQRWSTSVRYGVNQPQTMGSTLGEPIIYPHRPDKLDGEGKQREDNEQRTPTYHGPAWFSQAPEGEDVSKAASITTQVNHKHRSLSLRTVPKRPKPLEEDTYSGKLCPLVGKVLTHLPKERSRAALITSTRRWCENHSQQIRSDAGSFSCNSHPEVKKQGKDDI